MPLLTYTKENIPTPTEFRADLEQATEVANPVDDLLLLANRLWEFEQKHSMPSAQFYKKFQEGVLDDGLEHCFSWFATYDVYLKEKRTMEAALMRAALQTTQPDESRNSHRYSKDFFPHANSILEEVAA